ncbi:MAG: acyltransferase [Ktedonobacteraceae bacterium]|nr:acyltransferase [Ktedonobacteraceae bacterium]
MTWLTSILEPAKQHGTIAALDGVRAIACLVVVSVHISMITTQDISLWSPQAFPPLFTALAFMGDTGVTLFFVLSGFLLFLPYARALLFDERHWPAMRRFYLRRALRILPAYYVSLCLLVLLYRPEYLSLDHLRQWFFFLTLFMDSSSTTFKQISGPFWTLAVEWQFYLLLPWLALGMNWLVRRFRISSVQHVHIVLFCLGSLMLWGISTRILGNYLSANPSATFLLPRTMINAVLPFIYGAQTPGLHGKFLEDFAIGMLIATLYTLAHHSTSSASFSHMLPRLSPWLFASGLAWLLFMAMWKHNWQHPHTWLLLDPLNDVYASLGEFGFALGYGLFMSGVLSSASRLRRIFEWQPLRWIGLISYGIYMWHLLLLESFTDHAVIHFLHLPPILLYILYWIWLLVFIVPCAFLLFWLVEKPWQDLGKNLGRRKAVDQTTTG